MQRPRWLPLTAAASAGAIAGQLATRAFDGDYAQLSVDIGVLLPMICVSAIAITLLKRWMSQHAQLTTADIAVLAEQHRVTGAELDEKERQLIRRKRLLQDREAIATKRVESMAGRLAKALEQLAEERREHEELRANYTDLARDHDILVRRALNDGVQRFSVHETGRLHVGIPQAASATARPSATVAHLAPRDHGSV